MGEEQQPLPEVEQCVTSIPEDHEATCWGCGLRLVFASYAPVYKCGWCGAVTQSNQTSRKPDSVCFSRWRHFRDGFFVIVLILFMLFVICGRVWAVYPVVFSISSFCGIFHCTVTAFLAIFTIASYCLASLKSAGAPASIRGEAIPWLEKMILRTIHFVHIVVNLSPQEHITADLVKCVWWTWIIIAHLLGTVWELKITELLSFFLYLWSRVAVMLLL